MKIYTFFTRVILILALTVPIITKSVARHSFPSTSAMRSIGTNGLISKSLSLELNIATTMCLSQNEQLYNDLIHILEFTDTHLLYWQEVQHTTCAYFFSKGPFKWFSEKSQEQEILDHISTLQHCQSWAARQLGKVAQLTHQLKKAYSDEQIKPLLYQAINFVNNYLAMDAATLSIEQTITIQDLTQLLQKNVEHLQMAKLSIWTLLEQHKKPGHLTRNWLWYAAALGATTTAANYFYNHPEKPNLWFTMGHNGIKKFLDDHIKQPFCDIRDLLFSQPQNNEVQRLQHNVESLIQEKWPEISPSERQKILTGESSFLDDKWDEVVKNTLSIWDLITLCRSFPQLAQTGNIIVKCYRYRLLRDFGETSRLNFALFMTLPTALVLYGTYKTTKGLAHWCIPKYTFYVPVRNLLRSIGQLFNRYNSSRVTIGPEQYGYLLYWTAALKNYVGYMPSGIRKIFSEDLQELACPDLEIHQKLEIWNRMYKTYDFLTPHPAGQLYP